MESIRQLGRYYQTARHEPNLFLARRNSRRGSTTPTTTPILGADCPTKKTRINYSFHRLRYSETKSYLIAAASSCTPSPIAPYSYQNRMDFLLYEQTSTNLDVPKDLILWIRMKGCPSLMLYPLHPERDILVTAASRLVIHVGLEVGIKTFCSRS